MNNSSKTENCQYFLARMSFKTHMNVFQDAIEFSKQIL